MLKHSVFAVSMMLLGAATSAQAASYSGTVYAGSLVAPISTDSGGGHVVPTAGAINAPGYGTGSFYANVDKNTPDRYSTFRVNLAGLANRTVTIADLTSFSYLTQTTGNIDWRIAIYTTPGSNPAGNLGSFYASRIQAQPIADGTPGTWTTRSSSSLSFYESNLAGGSQTGTWTWDSVKAGNVTASPSGNTRNFSGETIAFIDFTLGANSGGGIESGYLDGINFNLSGGDTVTLDLEGAPAVPLPGAALAGAALLAKLGLTRRRLV